MDATVFAKFNESFDVKGLKDDIANTGTREMVEVPYGDYEVAVTKLELAESKSGQPMAKCWFKIVAGEYRGQLIFMNQMLTTGFGIHNMNDFMESLGSDVAVEFEDFVQYAQLMDTVFNSIDGRYEYQLAYGQNAKGYNTYNIVKRFDK